MPLYCAACAVVSAPNGHPVVLGVRNSAPRTPPPPRQTAHEVRSIREAAVLLSPPDHSPKRPSALHHRPHRFRSEALGADNVHLNGHPTERLPSTLNVSLRRSAADPWAVANKVLADIGIVDDWRVMQQFDAPPPPPTPFCGRGLSGARENTPYGHRHHFQVRSDMSGGADRPCGRTLRKTDLL